MYKVGETITTYYIDCPLPTSKQYQVGQEVEVFLLDSDDLIAIFKVDTTNEYEAQGTIIWVGEE